MQKLVGISASDRWTMFQQYVHAVAFGAADPLFGKDVGFFMFRLPVYQWAASFLFSWLVIAVVLVTVAAWFFGLRLLPGVVQTLRVRPSELTLETPYIQRNIQGTLAGYGLTRVRQRAFPGRPVTAEDVERNRPTLENVRLWDYRPLLAAYRQLQTLRQYYTFTDVDIDRYRVNGTQRQVMLAAREMDLARLPTAARGWVNEHLVFTHGFGLVLSPVNQISEEGMPELWIRDIPPQSVPGLPVTQPRIYFGELTNQFVVVNTRVQELDYPRGDDNAYTAYQGRAGIRLTWLNRLAFAYRLADLKLAISSDISARSTLLFGRNILARVQRIAPFLRYDRDPYVVVADGRLVWIIDAYTFSNRYPYSTPIQAGLNYIRNSVKVEKV